MLPKILRILLFPIAIWSVLLSCGPDENTGKASFTLQGTVVEKGVAATGVSITLNNQVSVTTDQAGAFSISNVDAGTYTLKPEQAGRSFFPAERLVPVTTQGVTALDFTRVAEDQTIHDETIWTMFRQSVYSIKQNSSSTLQLDLEQNALWYNNSQGGLIYRSIAGNFTITVRANAVRKTNNSQPVNCNICLGGLMVRNASASGGENYVHLVTGFTPNGLGVEFKSTTNGTSVFNTSADGSALHDLRIQRSGSTFSLFQKLTTENTWNLIASYNRLDLPAEVLVGVNIYTAQAGTVADLSMIFENIEIE